jgi:hypothetical protein
MVKMTGSKNAPNSVRKYSTLGGKLGVISVFGAVSTNVSLLPQKEGTRMQLSIPDNCRAVSAR